MNKTNLEHAGYAVLMQVVIGLLTGNWLAGALFGFAFFLGREHAQYQILLGYTFKTTFQAFDVRKWSLDAKLDLAFPFIAVTIVYIIKELL
jgi:hypothetical protein